MVRKDAFFVFAILLCIQTLVPAQTANIAIQADIAEGPLKSFLGVNGGPYPYGEDSGNTAVDKQYRDLGVNMVRTHGFMGPFDMQIIYPDSTADPSDPASFNFAVTDDAFQAAHDNGQEIYFRLGNSPHPD